MAPGARPQLPPEHGGARTRSHRDRAGRGRPVPRHRTGAGAGDGSRPVIYRFDQEIFFANASLFEREALRLVREAEPPPRAVLVDAAAISHIDTTGMAMIERLHGKLGDLGVTLMLARPRGPLRDILHRSGLDELIGPANVFPTVRAGVASFLHRAP